MKSVPWNEFEQWLTAAPLSDLEAEYRRSYARSCNLGLDRGSIEGCFFRNADIEKEFARRGLHGLAKELQDAHHEDAVARLLGDRACPAQS